MPDVDCQSLSAWAAMPPISEIAAAIASLHIDAIALHVGRCFGGKDPIAISSQNLGTRNHFPPDEQDRHSPLD
jgi:hypothetical protein